MKRGMKLVVIILTLLFISGCDFILDHEPVQKEKQYEIYLLAKESGYTGTYEDWLESIKGQDGVGILKIEKTATEGLVDTYTITYTNGSISTFKVTNGTNGIQGEKGEDGHTPIITIQNGNWFIDGIDTGFPTNIKTDSLYLNAYDLGIKPGNVDVNVLNELFKNDEVKTRVLYFPDGEYIFSDTIVLTSNWRIEGSINTVFKLSEKSTSNELVRLYNVDNVKLSNIKFAGTNTTKPSQKGDINGIVIEKCRSINLDNLDVVGFSKCGIYSKTMSSYESELEGAFYKQLQITNCRFYHNYYGTYFDYRCEYTQTLNCVFGENYIGSLNAGGNNIYTGSIWNTNTIGFYLENSGSNPAHGGCSGCTFNHNSSHAVYVENCVNGWVFNGCQIFYGKVELVSSKGVIFDSNIWGSCYFYSSFENNPNVNLISNTYFLTDLDVILKNNDGSTMIVDTIPEYKINQTVTFVYNDGINYKTVKVEKGETLKVLKPERLGYQFVGWYKTNSFDEEYDFDSKVEEDFTLYAKWVPLDGTVSDLDWTELVNTGTSDELLSLSTNAFSGSTTNPLAKGEFVSYIDFVINKGTKDTLIKGVNLWVVNSETGKVEEELISDRDFNSVYSDKQNSYVLRIELKRSFEYPAYFVIQSTRNDDGSGIAYYKSSQTNVGYLRGDNKLIVGETVTPNSNVVPVYTLYRENLSNISINFVGDSITYGVNTTKTYWEILKDLNEFEAVNGFGISGSCISATSDYKESNQPLVNRYMNLPYADLFVIFMGTNDYGHETPIGCIDDSTDVSFYGALNVIINGLQQKYPSSKIIFVTPLHRYGFGTSLILNEKYTLDSLPNGRGHNLNDYRDAIINIAKKYGLDVIDLYNEVNLHPESESARLEYIPDGIHPNQKGHDLIAACIKEYIYNFDLEDFKSNKIYMQYGNKFASGFDDQTRASSTINIYLEKGTVIKLKNSTEMTWAIAETNGIYDNTKISGYYPESVWSSIDSYIVEKSGYYGFTFKYNENNNFDFKLNPDSNDLMKYIEIIK